MTYSRIRHAIYVSVGVLAVLAGIAFAAEGYPFKVVLWPFVSVLWMIAALISDHIATEWRKLANDAIATFNQLGEQRGHDVLDALRGDRTRTRMGFHDDA